MAVLGAVRAVLDRWWVVLLLGALGATLLAAPTAPAGDGHTAATELIVAPSPLGVADPAATLRSLQLAARVAVLPDVKANARRQEPAVGRSREAQARVEEGSFTLLLSVAADDPKDAVAATEALAAAAVARLRATAGTELRELGDAALLPSRAYALPADRLDRAVVGGGLGATLGLLIVLLVPCRRRARVHDRAAVERAYSTSVLTEVPRTLGRARYAGYIALTARPSGTTAEAYRVLRCAVLNGVQGNLPRVIAVASPSRRDGRSSVAANLAAALAETGRRVLLVDADFGHPTLHYGIGANPGRGLSDLLTEPEPDARVAMFVQPSDTPGVAVLSIGTRGGRRPGSLATKMPQIIAAARRMVDHVVVDVEPLECAGDAVDTIGAVDAVLLVARSDRTATMAAQRCADLLDRCGARVVGAVLIGTSRERLARTPYLTASAPSQFSPERPHLALEIRAGAAVVEDHVRDGESVLAGSLRGDARGGVGGGHPA